MIPFGLFLKVRIKGLLVQGFWKISKINSNFPFFKIFKQPDFFYGRIAKRTKALGARFFDQFFWFFEIYHYEWKLVLSFFLNCWSWVHDAYTLLANFFFEKERRQNKCFVLRNVLFFPSKVPKIQDFKGFRSPNLEKIFKILRIHQILA